MVLWEELRKETEEEDTCVLNSFLKSVGQYLDRCLIFIFPEAPCEEHAQVTSFSEEGILAIFQFLMQASIYRTLC